jgi:hypothetical protein
MKLKLLFTIARAMDRFAVVCNPANRIHKNILHTAKYWVIPAICRAQLKAQMTEAI